MDEVAGFYKLSKGKPMNLDECKARMCARVAKRITRLCSELPDGDYWIAGGALTRDGTDVDFFAPGEMPPPPKDAEILSASMNAVTFKYADDLFQFCKYKKPTLAELVEAFDFAHCQVGCVAVVKSLTVYVKDVTWTPAFEASRITGTSWFTGSEFPLSSMIRVAKYLRSGVLSRGEAIMATIDTLAAVVKRGFDGYEDFKKQLDAVDLGLLPDELSQVDRSSLRELYALLNRRTDNP